MTIAAVAALLLHGRVLEERLQSDVNDHLGQEVEEMRALAGGLNPNTAEPFGDDARSIFDTFLSRNVPGEGEVFLTFLDGEPYKGTLAPYQLADDPVLVARWSQLKAVDRGEVDTPAGVAQYVAVPLRKDGETMGIFVVANFLSNEREEITDTLQVGAVVWASVLVVASVIAWLAAGRVLAPVRVLSETASQISQSDLSRRIPVNGHDELARLADVFNRMLDRLEGAFAAQRTFMDDAGHELRTPITVIRGHLELLSDDPDERSESLAIVADELGRMTRIVDDLLVLAKAEQPTFLEFAQVDLDLFTGEVFAKMKTLGDRDWRLAGTGHAVIVVDRQRLTQVLMNLAENAVRYTANSGRIEFGSSASHGTIELWVRDSGQGIPPEDTERIFERFTRGEGVRRTPGTAGLGLAIARAIVEAHGGSITVEGNPGEGATFRVVLPQQQEDHL
jgi:two-component system OmpR family sensor kinase